MHASRFDESRTHGPMPPEDDEALVVPVLVLIDAPVDDLLELELVPPVPDPSVSSSPHPRARSAPMQSAPVANRLIERLMRFSFETVVLPALVCSRPRKSARKRLPALDERSSEPAGAPATVREFPSYGGSRLWAFCRCRPPR